MSDLIDPRRFLTPELFGSLALVAVFFQGLRLWRGRDIAAFVEIRIPRRAHRRSAASVALIVSFITPVALFLFAGGIRDLGDVDAAPPGSTVTLTKDLTTQFQASGYATGDIALTITPAVTANAAAQTVTVSNTTNVVVGSRVNVDSAANAETIVVSAVPSATQITAIFSKNHGASAAAANTSMQFPSDTVQLVSSNQTPGLTLPVPSFASGTPPVIGRGGHAIQGQNGLYLIVRGGCSNQWSVYDAIANTFTAGTPDFGVNVCTGAFSTQVAANTFLLMAGGRLVGSNEATSSPLATIVVTATSSGFTHAPGPNLNGATGVGAGGHAIKRNDGNLVIVHGGGTTLTSFVTAGASPTIGAGAAGISTAIGDGAMSLPRTLDTKWLTLAGGGTRNTFVYDQTASPGSFSGGALAPANYGAGAGAHAIQYTDAACNGAAPNTCYRVIIGAGGSRTATYNPQGPAATTTLVGSGATTAAVGAGAFSVVRADAASSFLTFRGGATNGTNTFNGTTFAAGPALAATLGVGGFALQKTDGDYLVFLGNNTSNTALYDGGFRLRGTYTTEPLNPGNVNRWTELDWVKTADLNVTLRIRTATTSGGLTAATYTDVTTTSSTTGAFALTTGVAPVANKWAQVQTVLQRDIPGQGGAWLNVWGGSGGTAFQRSTSTNPTLDSVSLKYNLPELLVTAGASQTAGVGFTATITLLDESSNTVVDYTGTHTLVFSGASNAPDGTAPKVTNASATDIAFGTGTTVSFAAGVGSPTVKLFKQEGPVTISATEATGTGSISTYTLTAATILSTGAAVTVVPGATNAGTSSVAASPVAVPADNSTTSTITVTLRDAWQNLRTNVVETVALSSSRVASDTLVQPGGTSDANGQVSGTVRSTTFGGSVISATAGGTPLTATATVTFTAAFFVVTTTHAQTETANVPFTVHLKATDFAGNTVTNYNGNKTIVFSSTATTRSTPKTGVAPTIPSPQTFSFSSGEGDATSPFTLTNAAETPTITATQQSTSNPTGTSAAITVQVNVIDPGHSEMYASPQPAGCMVDACVLADGVQMATIEVRLYDVVNNPLSGRTVSLSSSRGVTDTITQPSSTTNANGVTTGTVRSTGTGTATISAQGSPKNPAGLLLAQDTSSVTVTQTRQVKFLGTHFEFTINPSGGWSVNAGAGFTLHLRLLDENDQLVTSYSGSHTISFTTTATARVSPAAGPAPVIPSPQTITFTSGAGDTLGGASQFVLYNTAQTPTISASEGVQFLGATANITIVAGVASLSQSLMSASPTSQLADGSSTAAITVTVTDAYRNPRSGFTVTVNTDGTLGTCGTCETLSPSGGPTQPATGTTNANGAFVATATSKTVRVATYSAAISGTGGANGTLTATAQVSWSTSSTTDHFTVQVVFPAPPYASGATAAIAGVPFQLVVTAKKPNDTADTNYCTSTCTITINHTSSTAPDGSAPSPASGTSVAVDGTNGPFVNGVWTTPLSFITFYAAQTTRTVSVADANAATGTSVAFDVVAAATSPSVSIIIATPRTVPADGIQTADVRARATDAYRNPKTSLSVTFSSDLAGSSFSGATTQTTGSDGITPAIQLSSSAEGLANLSATISGTGSIGGTTVRFAIAASRVALGSHYGLSTNGTLTKFPLEVTAVCNGTCDAPNAAGKPLPDGTTIEWLYTSSDGGAGLFDNSAGIPASPTINTAGAYGASTHKTAFQVTRAGSFCIQARWQNPDASFTTVDVACGMNKIVGVGVFDIVGTETTSGNAVTTRARAIWDGITLRVVGWWTDR